MHIFHTSDPEVPARDIADRINGQIQAGHPVTWLLSGGSAIKVAVAASLMLKEHPLLHISLVDERYGPPDHKDSNYRQLVEAGFALPIHPVLTGEAIEREATDYGKWLYERRSDYWIGIFGMGADGHTAGILPDTDATPERISEGLVFFYSTSQYDRITTTPLIISPMDAAYLWAQGEDKAWQLQRLQDAIDPAEQPVQYLKQSAELCLYTDQLP